jgi:hypothetical protein
MGQGKKLIFRRRTLDQILKGSYEARYRKYLEAVSALGWGHPWVFEDEGNGFFAVIALALGRDAQDLATIRKETLAHMEKRKGDWTRNFRQDKDFKAYVRTRQKEDTTPDYTMIAATAWAAGVRIQLGQYSEGQGTIVQEILGDETSQMLIRIVKWEKRFTWMRDAPINEDKQGELRDEMWPVREGAFHKSAGRFGRVIRVTPDWQSGFRAVTILAAGGEGLATALRRKFLTHMRKAEGSWGIQRARELAERKELQEDDWQVMARFIHKSIKLVSYSDQGEVTVATYEAQKGDEQITIAHWSSERQYVAVTEEVEEKEEGTKAEVRQSAGKRERGKINESESRDRTTLEVYPPRQQTDNTDTRGRGRRKHPPVCRHIKPNSSAKSGETRSGGG